jgi:hypothetical protein
VFREHEGIDSTAGPSYSAQPEGAATQDRYDIAATRDEKPSALAETLRRTAVVFGFAAAAAVTQSPATVTAWAATDLSHPVQAREKGSALAKDRRSLLASEVTAYRGLKAGWDGDDGVAPSGEAIADALSFIRLLPLRARLPKPMVAGDGEVGFYWKSDDCYIDVGFFGNGTISYYGHAKREGFEVHDTTPYDRRALPKDLLAVIMFA